MMRKIKIIIITLWVTFALLCIGTVSLFLMLENNAFDWFGELPGLQALEQPETSLSSELISSDGALLGKYYRENRIQINYDDLSPELVNTLLVTEDVRFEQHSGIDLKGLIRAIFGTMTFNFQGGGSTITMQLAENLYKTNTSKQGRLYKYRKIGQIVTKLKEWIIAIKLEKSYTKKEIIAMYLNTIEFGSNAHGIKVASRIFFNMLPSELSYSESAVLVGIINAPTRWSPVYNLENATKKRTQILWKLHQHDVLDKVAYDSLNTKSIALNYKVQNQNQGLATSFRSILKQYLVKWAKKNGYDLFKDGLKIYTTIDSRVQQLAENAMKGHMKNLQEKFKNHWKNDNPWIDNDGEEIPHFIKDEIKKTDTYKALKNRFEDNIDSITYYLSIQRPMKIFSWKGEIDTVLNSYDSLSYYKKILRSGLMSMDPKSGHIKAWVGSINYKYFKYDNVKQGKRQPGSTFKPIIYTAAIDNGYSPCFSVIDAPVSFNLPGQDPPTWVPQNSNGKFSGRVMTMGTALSQSVNSVTAYIMNRIGPSLAVKYAKRLGITSPLQAVPSLCLGAGGDVSVYEMVNAYATFVNKGTRIEPFFLERIEDKYGNIIQNFFPKEEEAINEKSAYIMLKLLMNSTKPGGTAARLDYRLKQGNEIAAKTGTTQNASDGWFIGVTKDLVTGIWVGGENRSIKFRNWAMGQGARTAMPIWEKYMLSVYNDPTLNYKKGKFEKPRTEFSVDLACEEESSSNDSNLDDAPIAEDDFF